MRKSLIIVAVVSVVFVLSTMGCALLAPQVEPEMNKEARLLVPVFSTALDSPNFTLDYVNDTSESVAIMDLLLASTVEIDGRMYPRTGVKLVGGDQSLRPGQRTSFSITLGEYLPNWEKKGYSEILKRWRWKPPLKSGIHTLLVKVGDKEYEPITFHWKGDLPLLYE